jgi:hypothetical protein
MKNTKVDIFEWSVPADQTVDAQYDIDWPRVQNAIGKDHCTWLLEQKPKDVQLMLEVNGNGVKRLVADFYDPKVLVTYHLMWAK